MPKTTVIDLSHYQVIPKDLKAAASAGVQAVIHKATEGTKGLDPKAKARKSLTQDAGLLWGVYHFMRPGKVGDQVDHFLSKHYLIDSDTLLVLDFEVNGIPLTDVRYFLERISQETSQMPVLYSGNTLKEAGGASKVKQLADYRLWIAQYNKTGPTLPKGYKDWWLWQYSDKGKVRGIEDTCDVNAYNGDDLSQDWVIKTSTAGQPATDGPTTKNSIQSQTANLTEGQPPIDPSVPDASTEQNVAVVKEENLGFWSTLGKKITAAFTGIGGATGLTTYAQQGQSFGLSSLFWERIFYIALVGFLGWIIIEVLRWFYTTWQKRKRTNTLVAANATPNNSVTVIRPEQTEEFKKAGWVVIGRS